MLYLQNPVDNSDNNKLGNAETETLNETALNSLKPTPTDLTTHNIFNLRDREQVPAFDSTVSAPDFGTETFLQDEDYLSNNLLATENCYLLIYEDNEPDITDLNDDNTLTGQQVLPIETTEFLVST